MIKTNPLDGKNYNIAEPTMKEIVDASGVIESYEFRSLEKVQAIKNDIESSYTAILNDIAEINALIPTFNNAVNNLNGNWESAGGSYEQKELQDLISEPLKTAIGDLKKLAEILGSEKIITTAKGSFSAKGSDNSYKNLVKNTAKLIKNCTKIEENDGGEQ